jgi:hypothetical protein
MADAQTIYEVEFRTLSVHNLRLGYGIAAYAQWVYPFVRDPSLLRFQTTNHTGYRDDLETGSIKKAGKFSAFPD